MGRNIVSNGPFPRIEWKSSNCLLKLGLAVVFATKIEQSKPYFAVLSTGTFKGTRTTDLGGVPNTQLAVTLYSIALLSSVVNYSNDFEEILIGRPFPSKASQK